MTNSVPPLPDSALGKVLAVSFINGWSITIIAGLSLLLTLFIGNVTGIVISLLVTLAGVVELHGRQRLKAGDALGGRCLLAAQLVLMAVLCVYCLWQLLHLNPQDVMKLIPAEIREVYEASGNLSHLERLAQMGLVAVYGGVILASLVHQGGLFYFYRRSLAKIGQACVPPPIPGS